MTVQAKILAIKRQAACGGANRRFQFHKRSQLFFGSRNETLSIVAMPSFELGDPSCLRDRRLQEKEPEQLQGR